MFSETLEIIHELEALKGSLRGEVEARAAVIGAGCVPRDRFGLVTWSIVSKKRHGVEF